MFQRLTNQVSSVWGWGLRRKCPMMTPSIILSSRFSKSRIMTRGVPITSIDLSNPWMSWTVLSSLKELQAEIILKYLYFNLNRSQVLCQSTHIFTDCPWTCTVVFEKRLLREKSKFVVFSLLSRKHLKLSDFSTLLREVLKAIHSILKVGGVENAACLQQEVMSLFKTLRSIFPLVRLERNGDSCFWLMNVVVNEIIISSVSLRIISLGLPIN